MLGLWEISLPESSVACKLSMSWTVERAGSPGFRIYDGLLRRARYGSSMVQLIHVFLARRQSSRGEIRSLNYLGYVKYRIGRALVEFLSDVQKHWTYPLFECELTEGPACKGRSPHVVSFQHIFFCYFMSSPRFMALNGFRNPGSTHERCHRKQEV